MAALSIDVENELAWLRDLARAAAGALLFGMPLLMTMEMWQAGFAMDRARLALFLLTGLPLLFGLARYAGFSRERGLKSELLDAFSALAVGHVVALVLLLMFGVLDGEAALSQSVGQVSLQAVPGAVGALLARRQLGERGDADENERPPGSYFGELFLMAAGALFLAFNVAPTEEMVLIAYMASPWHALAIVAASLALLHAVVFSVGFAGQEEHDRPVTAFFHFTLPGYGLALVLSLYVLWAFGRTDGHDLAEIATATVVLGFPAALGAAAARLLV